MNILTLKSTLRQFKKNKFFSGLNVLGLALGLTSFLFLQYYISFERDYESFIPENEQVYRINFDEFKNGERVLHSAKAHSRLAVMAPQEIAEIEQSSYSLMELNVIKYDRKSYNGQKTLWVAGDFAEMMGLEMISGESKLKDPYTCLVSEKWAKSVFDDKDPVGEKLLVNGAMEIYINGVYKDLPSNTHFDFDNLMSIQTWDAYGWIPGEGNWEWLIWSDYVKLKKGADPIFVEKEINRLGAKYLTQFQQDDRSFEYHLQPINEVHFANELEGETGISTRKSTLSTLHFVSLLVLLIALVNFINIETALINKSQNYLANLKKLGATKSSLMFSGFIRSASISVVAVLLSLVAFQYLSKYFGVKLQIPFSMGVFNMNSALIAFAAIIVIVVFVSTLFSAIAIVKINPVQNRKVVSHKHPVTRFLVGGQFTIAIVLMIASFMVMKQVQYMQSANLGMNIEQVMCISGSAATNGNPERGSVFESFKREAMTIPTIKAASYSQKVPGQSVGEISTNVNLLTSRSASTGEFQMIFADASFIETFDVELLAGRNLHNSYQSDSNSVLLSEMAIITLGFDSPYVAIDKEIINNNEHLRIVGVVRNFHHQGLKSEVSPIIIYNRHPSEFGYVAIKVAKENAQTVSQIKTLWEKYYPNDPFQYFYNDEFFKKQYNSDIRFSKIIIGFTLLAIFVAIFGLFGMVTFVVQERNKEIGVRKVNGATVMEVLRLINKDFVLWVSLAFIVALPIAYYVVFYWLQGFAYKTNISWWVFALSGLTAIVVTIITVSWLSIRAARRNPMEILRYE